MIVMFDLEETLIIHSPHMVTQSHQKNIEGFGRMMLYNIYNT